MQEVNKRVYLCVQACTLARRTAETFLKYVNRNLHFLGMQMKFRSPEGHVKGKNGLVPVSDAYSVAVKKPV